MLTLTLTQAGELFQRYLDLSSLRGRRRGLVRCIFHEDRRASLSVDLDRGLFHCFACGAEGGTKGFLELLGERPGPPIRFKRQPDRLARWRPIFELAHCVKKFTDLVDRLRREATRLGPTERAWDLLAEAVKFETAAFGAEAQIEEMLAAMRRR